jgi:hypothetical protein
MYKPAAYNRTEETQPETTRLCAEFHSAYKDLLLLVNFK